MGSFLIALSLHDAAQTAWYILLVVLGLGMLIFVHEFGHFIVAKLCGVKVEKFYLGFDIAGLKIWKYRRGETEYGIGILPLGGYVKMLGQEDNPARLREEIARAKAQTPSPSAVPSSRGAGEAGEEPIDVAAAERALYDPRSYLAQSVPERIAIISAGVVMNVIFAFVTAVIAYVLGVFQPACGVGAIVPGEAAWQSGQIEVGDQIREINGRPVARFEDLQKSVMLGNIDKGVEMEIQRPGVEKPLTVTLSPDRKGLAPTIGIASPWTTTLRPQVPAFPGSTAAKAQPALLGGDKIIEIGDVPVTDYSQVYRQLALHRDETLKFTIERTARDEEGKPILNKDGRPERTERLTVDVASQPMNRLGIMMKMGPVTAVQSGSPAEKAGIQPGDVLQAIDGKPIEDAMFLDEQLRRRSLRGDHVKLTVLRDEQPRSFDGVALRKVDEFVTPFRDDSPMAAAALGVAYQVERQVTGTVPGSPAADAGLKKGDVVIRAKIIPPDKKTLEDLGYAKLAENLSAGTAKVDFVKDHVSWPSFFYEMQSFLPRTRVELTLEDDRTVPLDLAEAKGWFNPERGLRFEPKGTLVQAKSLGAALSYGGQETVDALKMVVRFLDKLRSRQVSWRGTGGPITIAKMAYYSASKGLSRLLIFLTLIGANLAVLNILPIPLLDGGHLVFLIYEGVTGRPPNERVQLALTYVGLLFVLALFVLVFGLDLGLISRK